MTTERDPGTRIVLSWLREDAHENAERVLLSALDEVDTTPQRRPFRAAWRFLDMNNPVRYAIAAAAVVVVALIGSQFLPLNLGVAGQTPESSATPAPTATPAPSVAPSSAGARAIPLTDALEAGQYVAFPGLKVTVDAPAGWATCCQNPAYAIYHGEPGAAIFFEDFTGVTVHSKPCTWNVDRSSKPVGAEAIANALAAQSGSAIRKPEPTNVAGLPGFHVRMVVPGDLKVEAQTDGDSTFVTCDGGLYTFWTARAGDRYAQGLNEIEDVYIVDVGDRTLAFDLSSFPNTSDADIAAIEAMLDSVEIN